MPVADSRRRNTPRADLAHLPADRSDEAGR
ncbi:hypothetical protein FHR81_002004 [Actinoalloteichus hoggarensis]|uniref:Uncharacterized protein n=1 Tax=Actinoalloteichus hoggarensis TaxID=1470176 RepID=A0A221W586_9PSEU|nr:hypothetical protein AHOG_17045 [Actinoalloteichus hoggarensis]MBB5920966.1 hypothetical protein [Actinoalloteichus hoggarensis]